jgi:hypothetical protein
LDPDPGTPKTAKTAELVLVADNRLDDATLRAIEERASNGAEVIAWQHRGIVQDRFPSPDVASVLTERGIAHRSISSCLGEDGDDSADDAVIAWMKDFGRRELGKRGSFRERFRYGSLVLWWWAELYLYHETPLRLIIRDVEVLARLCEKRRPGRIVLAASRRCLAEAATAFAPRVELIGARVSESTSRLRTILLHYADFLKMLGTGLKSVFRAPAAPSPVSGGKPKVLFLSHASMWRERPAVGAGADDKHLYEIYFDRLIPALRAHADVDVEVVAFGPPEPFRHRRAIDLLRDILELKEERRPYRPIRRYFTPKLALRLASAFSECRRLWRELEAISDLGECVTHRGVSLWPQAEDSFRDTFLRQFPWAIRSYEELRGAIETERASVLVLYAESSGLGRAAVTACRTAGVRSFALQHGIMYPRYFSHEHAPDELEGEDGGEAVPIPSMTAVFGALAMRLLVERGNYPSERIRVTGSPKFDALLETARGYDRDGIRARLGISNDDRLLVLATRFSAIGAEVLKALVEAVLSRDKLWLLIKPHQAEPDGPYRDAIARLSHSELQSPSGSRCRCRIADRDANLVELLVASDGLVTVDSLASSEALVLDRPVLVVNLPSNLGPLVERGVALGVRAADGLGQALDELVSDAETRRRLAEASMEYRKEFAFGVDGHSTERIVGAILEQAGVRSESESTESSDVGRALEGPAT